MKKFELLAASAIALLSATPALAQTDTAAPTQTEPSTTAPGNAGQAQVGGIGDIIVTAQRQSQRLQDVPIAVSAFTAQNLAQQQIVTVVGLRGAITRSGW